MRFAICLFHNPSYHFWGLYKQQNITVGNEESFTYTTSKKQYLFWTTFLYLVVVFAYGYFICVVNRYSYRLRNKDEKKEEDMMMDDDENQKSMMMN